MQRRRTSPKGWLQSSIKISTHRLLRIGCHKAPPTVRFDVEDYDAEWSTPPPFPSYLITCQILRAAARERTTLGNPIASVPIDRQVSVAGSVQRSEVFLKMRRTLFP